MNLVERFRGGDRRALSRAVSLAERGDAAFPALFDAVWDAVGRAVRVGVTGPPGAGKSTLVSALVGARRAEGQTVGVVAVDPTSPFTGGALLGDRVRMGEHTLDPGVFVRSMATRGSLGGLARRTLEVVDLFDAFGFAHVLLETVGVGQIEHDVCEASDLVVVVLHPGAGDSVQAMKAGLLELADVFVINKADQDGADRLERELDEMMQLRLHRHGEAIPICRTVAVRGDGCPELAQVIDARVAELGASGERARRASARAAALLERIVQDGLAARLWGEGGLGAKTRELVESTVAAAPYATAERLLAELVKQEG